MHPVRRVSHVLRELFLHFQRVVAGRSKLSIAICVDDSDNGQSSGLRGYELARQLKRLGWRAFVIPKQLGLRQRLRFLEKEQPLVVYLQMTRHPLNCPELYPGHNCVLDIDDADFLDPVVGERVKQSMRSSFGVIAGSTMIRTEVLEHNSRCEVVWTGARPTRSPALGEVKKIPPIVVWACSNPKGYAAEGEFVCDVIQHVNRQFQFEFLLIGGVNYSEVEHYLEPLRAAGIAVRWIPFMPYKKLIKALGSATIGLAPLLPHLSPFSGGKSFGKVLAYLNAGLCVVASDAADHKLFFRDHKNGIIAGGLTDWVRVIEKLIQSPQDAYSIGHMGRRDFQLKLSSLGMACHVDKTLRNWLAVEQMRKTREGSEQR